MHVSCCLVLPLPPLLNPKRYCHRALLQAFDQAGRLPNLEAFASHHGADFYGLPRNKGSITLVSQLAGTGGGTPSKPSLACQT